MIVNCSISDREDNSRKGIRCLKKSKKLLVTINMNTSSGPNVINIHLGYGKLVTILPLSGPKISQEYYWVFEGFGKICLVSKCCTVSLQLHSGFTRLEAVEPLFADILARLPECIRIVEVYTQYKTLLFQALIESDQALLTFLKHNPALGFLIILTNFDKGFDNNDFSSGAKDISRLILKKRKEILRRTGFNAEEWVVRLFHKIPAGVCSREFFDKFKQLLFELSNNNLKTKGSSNKKKRLKILKHVPEINEVIVEILSEHKMLAYFSYSFFLEIATIRNPRVIRDMRNIFYLFKEKLNDRAIEEMVKIPEIKSLSDFTTIIPHLTDSIDEIDMVLRTERLKFGIPPIPPLELTVGDMHYGIFPIRNGEELIQESKTMVHCIATYGESIAVSRGCRFAYHVHLPGSHEATVIVVKNGDRYEIEEINGRCNEPATRNVVMTVQNWLDEWNQENCDESDCDRD